jgi:tetratricopeptide (TPR) repeat protein
MGLVMSAAKRRRRRRRHLLTVTAVVLIAASIAAVSWRWSRAAKVIAPPLIDLTEVDPAVRRAVESARAAVLHTPDSATAWGKLGMVLMAHGLPIEASTACLAQAERLEPRQPRWPYLQAIGVVTTDPEAAIPKLQRAVELCDCDPDAPRLQLGEVLLDRGRFEEAADQFRRVVQKQPNNARASLGLGRVTFEKGALSESVSHLQPCLSDAHTRKAANLLLAQIHTRLGNESAAEQARRQAADLPKDTDWPDRFQDEVDQQQVGKQPMLALADRLIHQGHHKEAFRLLQRAVHDYPDSPWAWVMVGRACLGGNDLPAAERALRKATELGPDVAEAHFYLGVALILQKKTVAATTCFRKATELKPDFALAHYNLGHSLKEQGDDAGAIAAFRTAINCKPDEGRAHFNLAQLLIKRGQRDDALVHLRHAVRLNPTDPAAKTLLEQVEKQAAVPGGIER